MKFKVILKRAFWLSGLFCFLGFTSVFAAEEKILNIYGWAGYLPEKIIQQFQIETGIRVNYATYVNNEVMYAKLKANPNTAYDIIIPSSYYVSRLLKNGLIQKIDYSQLTEHKQLNPVFLNRPYDPENAYSIPYLWNSTGIVVNKRFHDVKKIHAWQDLWSTQYRDQLLVLDDARECFSVALMALRYSINTRQPKEIELAFQKLKELIPNAKLFNIDAQRSIYLDEDITIGMGWNGDIFLAQQENPALDFIYPEEGFIITLDTLAIPKAAKHIENAHRFIDFILRPEIAKQIAIESGFSTANLGAFALLPTWMKENPILYPNAAILKKGQFQADVGDAMSLYEHYFERLKLEQ